MSNAPSLWPVPRIEPWWVLINVGVGPSSKLHLFFDHAEHVISGVLGGTLQKLVPSNSRSSKKIYMMRAGIEDGSDLIHTFDSMKEFLEEFQGQKFRLRGGKSSKASKDNIRVWLTATATSPIFTCDSRQGIEFYITTRPPLRTYYKVRKLLQSWTVEPDFLRWVGGSI